VFRQWRGPTLDRRRPVDRTVMTVPETADLCAQLNGALDYEKDSVLNNSGQGEWCRLPAALSRSGCLTAESRFHKWRAVGIDLATQRRTHNSR
jgi:hypothetical protein